MDRDKLKALLIRHEGVRLRAYQDTRGKITIGVGRNIEDCGISEVEAMVLLDNDIAKAVSYCRDAFAWFNGLDDSRQNVVVSLVFNLGATGFSGFKKMIAALERGDFDTAANEMKNSLWASQIGKRAVELADLMENGDTLH